ncbi:MAG TPA: sugar phosphate isomerase/epimerase family protein [Candidatus Dormibacteraeota bacterium]|nr:sugar phosphate isomerase/epimerase family protein [Candidatus Dormibacteraeota bacterium]
MKILFLPVTILFLSLLCISTAKEQTHPVSIGYCAELAEIDAVKWAGFDYIELRTSEIAALSDQDYEKIAAKLNQIELPVPTTYLFIPASIKLTGPETDKVLQMNYVRKALNRVSKLGAHTVVLGAGTARQYPAGFPKETAFRQLIDFCKRLGPEARTRDITIAVEPLRKQESNIINTVAEGLELVRAVQDPNIQLNVDFYHLEVEKENPAIILEAKSHIRHVHMANPEGRVFPLNWEEYNYGPFFKILRKIGYQKEISIEGRTADFVREAPRAIAFLRGAVRAHQ